jgi:hypothetical protein
LPGKAAGELHRDAVAAEPQRAGRMAFRHTLVDRVFGRGYAVDGLLAGRVLFEPGVPRMRNSAGSAN